MKSRECNNTPSQQNVCCSLSIPSSVFIYYYVICVEGNPNERNEKTSYVCIYICMWCVCVSICVYYIYEYVCDRFCMALWQVYFLLLHSGPVESAARSQRCCC